MARESIFTSMVKLTKESGKKKYQTWKWNGLIQKEIPM